MKALFWLVALVVCVGIMVGLPIMFYIVLEFTLLESFMATALIYVGSLGTLLSLCYFELKHSDDKKNCVDNIKKM